MNTEKSWWQKPEGLLFSTAVCLLGFAFFALYLVLGKLGGFDGTVYGALIKYDNPAVKRLMVGLTFCGSEWFITPIAAVLFTAAVREKGFRVRGMTASLSPAAAWVVNYLLKAIFRRSRPAVTRWLVAERGFSFPSAHAMVSAAFYGSLICLCFAYLRKPWRGLCTALLLLLAAAVGVSRAFLGVHYPSDVAAGFFAGFAQAFFAAYLTERPGRFRHPRKPQRAGPAGRS